MGSARAHAMIRAKAEPPADPFGTVYRRSLERLAGGAAAPSSGPLDEAGSSAQRLAPSRTEKP